MIDRVYIEDDLTTRDDALHRHVLYRQRNTHTAAYPVCSCAGRTMLWMKSIFIRKRLGRFSAMPACDLACIF
jgi:hypothetical protein